MKSLEFVIDLAEQYGVNPVTKKVCKNFTMYGVEITEVLSDLRILEILLNNITLIDGNRIDFYKDKYRNINCKIDQEDAQKIRNYLISRKPECKILNEKYQSTNINISTNINSLKNNHEVPIPKAVFKRRWRPKKEINKTVRIKKHSADSWR